MDIIFIFGILLDKALTHEVYFGINVSVDALLKKISINDKQTTGWTIY